MKKTGLCGVALLALLIAGCSQSAPDTREADAKALRDLETQWDQDYVAKDIDKLVAHYADNAVVMVPGMPASSGIDAIRAQLKEMLKDPALSMKSQTSKVEVAKSGDLAYTEGSYTITMTNPASKQTMNDHGSYVTVYRKQPDGNWKVVADIGTSEVPMSAAPSPLPKKRRVVSRRRSR